MIDDRYSTSLPHGTARASNHGRGARKKNSATGVETIFRSPATKFSSFVSFVSFAVVPIDRCRCLGFGVFNPISLHTGSRRRHGNARCCAASPARPALRRAVWSRRRRPSRGKNACRTEYVVGIERARGPCDGRMGGSMCSAGTVLDTWPHEQGRTWMTWTSMICRHIAPTLYVHLRRQWNSR